MFNATRSVAIATVLALTGTLALVAGPFDGHDRADVAPTAQVWAADDVVPVEVRAAYRGEEPGSIGVTPERVSGQGTRMEYELSSDDPRFDGAHFVRVATGMRRTDA